MGLQPHLAESRAFPEAWRVVLEGDELRAGGEGLVEEGGQGVVLDVHRGELIAGHLVVGCPGQPHGLIELGLGDAVVVLGGDELHPGVGDVEPRQREIDLGTGPDADEPFHLLLVADLVVQGLLGHPTRSRVARAAK